MLPTLLSTYVPKICFSRDGAYVGMYVPWWMFGQRDL